MFFSGGLLPPSDKKGSFLQTEGFPKPLVPNPSSTDASGKRMFFHFALELCVLSRSFVPFLFPPEEGLWQLVFLRELVSSGRPEHFFVFSTDSIELKRDSISRFPFSPSSAFSFSGRGDPLLTGLFESAQHRRLRVRPAPFSCFFPG